MDAGLVGRLLLYAAMATSVWGTVASVGGKLRRDRGLAASGRRGLYATTGLLLGILDRLDSNLANGTRIASGICVSGSRPRVGVADIDDREILSSFHSFSVLRS